MSEESDEMVKSVDSEPKNSPFTPFWARQEFFFKKSFVSIKP